MVENFLRLLEFEGVLRFLVPWQREDPVQIVSGNSGLCHHRRHGFEMVDFLLEFLLVFFRNGRVCQFLPVVFRFLILADGVAQTVVDGFNFLS